MTSFSNIKYLVIDLETFSSVDLKKSGVYPYVEAPDFESLLAAILINGEEPIVYDLASGEKLPEEIINAIKDEKITKIAYNCNFERVCLSRYFGLPTGSYLSPRNWKDTMILSLYNGFPRALGQVGEVLHLQEQKMREGKNLIRYFCVPCKPTKSNGFRTRNLPKHDHHAWEIMKQYNKQDVITELAIENKFKVSPVPDSVWEEFYLDQEINDRGILVDMALVNNAIKLDNLSKAPSKNVKAAMIGSPL